VPWGGTEKSVAFANRKRLKGRGGERTEQGSGAGADSIVGK